MRNKLERQITVYKFLMMTACEYNTLLFEIGIEYLEKCEPKLEYLSKTKIYWHYAEVIIDSYFYSLATEKENKGMVLVDSEENYNIVKREIFDQMYITEGLLKKANEELLDTVKKVVVRHPKAKKQQLEIRLNTN